MNDLLEEVKESIKEEKVNKILKILSIIILSIGVIVFIITIVITSVKLYNKKTALQESRSLYSAIKNHDINQLNTLSDGNSIYSVIANFYIANLSMLSSNHSKAILHYQKVARSSSYGSAISDYAKLHLIWVKMIARQSDNNNIINNIDDIIGYNSCEKPFSSAALLLRAALEFDEGDKEIAIKTLKLIPNDINEELKHLTTSSLRYLNSLQ